MQNMIIGALLKCQKNELRKTVISFTVFFFTQQVQQSIVESYSKVFNFSCLSSLKNKKGVIHKNFLPRIPAVPTDGGAGVSSRVWFHVRRHVPAVTSGMKVLHFRPQRSLKDGIPIR